jgi:hypothetical protein
LPSITSACTPIVNRRVNNRQERNSALYWLRIAGMAFAIKGIRADFRQRLFAAARARKWIVRLDEFGLARSAVFALLGIF